MKTPNQKNCTIEDMLEWATAESATKLRKGRKASMIAWILANAKELTGIRTMRWSAREWAMTALRDIERIGIIESLAIVPTAPINGVTSPIHRLRAVCKVLGVYLNKVNGRTIITRQQLTAAPKHVMLSDMPVDRRGESSPDFGLYIDPFAKPTSLV